MSDKVNFNVIEKSKATNAKDIEKAVKTIVDKLIKETIYEYK